MDCRNDLEIQASRKRLLATFRDSPDLVFVRAWGNIGDDLIYAGTRQLLTGLNYREVSIQDLRDTSGHTALIAGSGGWCKPFHAMPSFLPAIEERFHSVIVLPSTFDISEEIVRTSLQKTNALVFSRESASYRAIQSLCKSDIAHDCAFFFDYEKYRGDGRGVLNAFRTDAEANGRPLPEGNIDISVACSSLDEWLWTISKYAVVRTDKAHVMIAAAMLGKRVEYGVSIYHKVPAIAEYALKRYPVCPLSDTPTPLSKPARLQVEDFSPIPRFAAFLSERFEGSKVVVIDDLESFDFDGAYPKDAIVVIPNAISSLERFPHRIEPLKKMLQDASRAIFTDDINSFPDTKVVETFLKRHDFSVEFLGFVRTSIQKMETLAIIAKSCSAVPTQAPEAFRVIAIMSSYNEEDIIVPAIEQLRRDGVDVYLIDNWSTDGTYEKAQSLLGKGLIGLERFPAEGSSPIYVWRDLLKRKEELSRELKANWFIHHDVDEYRESPWQGVRLRDAIYRVDQQGYNAIDFSVLNFVPVDDNYQPGTSFFDYFKHCEFPTEGSCFIQIKAWKATDAKVTIHETGGHIAEFAGRKIYPYKFLLRHYPIRSQSHGVRKIFQDRKVRYSPKEKTQGWHTHYDSCDPGANFLKHPKALLTCDSSFYSEHLVERLSGIGLIPSEISVADALRRQLEERELAFRDVANQVVERNREICGLSEQWRSEIARFAAFRSRWRSEIVRFAVFRSRWRRYQAAGRGKSDCWSAKSDC